jgi:hypothetical protein
MKLYLDIGIDLGGSMQPILFKGHTTPIDYELKIAPMNEQKEIEVGFYEGQRALVKDNKLLGKILLSHNENLGPFVVDLHIEKLVPSKRGMSNYDILTLQMETAKRQLDFAIKNRMPKVVFIHGVGEGVLKAELDFMLGRYDTISFQDANYQKYGLGATEVYIKQNVK